MFPRVWSGRKAGKSAPLVENGEEETGRGDLSFCEGREVRWAGSTREHNGRAQRRHRGAPNRIRVVH